MKYKVKLLMANGKTITATVEGSEIEKAFDKQAAKSEYVKTRLIGGVAVHFHAETEPVRPTGDELVRASHVKGIK